MFDAKHQTEANAGLDADAKVGADSAPITYERLLSLLPAELSKRSKRRDGALVRNARTAVRMFICALGKEPTDEVGEELGTSFTAALETYVNWEVERGLAMATVKPRRTFLEHARQLVARMRASHLPPDFAGALDALITASGLDYVTLEKRSGIGKNSISEWRRGRSSPGAWAHRVPDLERALGAPGGTLTGRLPAKAAFLSTERTASVAPRTKYQERLRRIAALPRFSLRDVSARLKQEWSELLKHKTAEFPRQRRDRRGRWTAKEARLCAPRSPAWCCTLADGRVAMSAHAAWVQIRQYLGWLALPVEQGGRGWSVAEVQSLGALTDWDAVTDFIHWRAERAGAINEGASTFVATVASLVHPGTGWIAKSPYLASRTRGAQGETPEQWGTRCEKAFDELRVFLKKVKASARATRDPEEPIRLLLESGDPLQMLMQFVESLKATMPPKTQPLRRAMRLRDIAVASLLIAYPMRIGQLQALEYGEGTDENLRRRDGRWELSCAAERFKNGSTTMKKGVQLLLDEGTSEDLERYVSEGRPYLLKKKRSPYFFVGTGRWNPNTPCENLEDRLQVLTERFIPGCPGFRGHGWRHIIATAWLIEHPKDYLTVADLLGDSLQTVIRAYRHLETAQAVSSYSEWAMKKRR